MVDGATEVARTIFRLAALLVIAFVLSLCAVRFAHGEESRIAAENSTAQGVANIMARLGRVGHFGGNRGYEGCGMASTKDGAYNICCYSQSGMPTIDVGYAQDARGFWYCCRRYGSGIVVGAERVATAPVRYVQNHRRGIFGRRRA